ncbi:MAG: type II toxin-antitoxin system RelE/ParE family toxin [Hyphomicrobium sp.]
MMRIVVATDAEGDIGEILAYLQREAGRSTAVAYSERFVQAIERMADFPGHGTPRPALGSDARIALVYPYLLIYDFNVVDDTATLLRVLHGKRDITERLIKRKS